MGVVYRAEDLKLGRTVALKFVSRGNEASWERLRREAQAAAALHHPNIATVFEIDEEHRFLAMEFVEGKTLGERIAERPLPCREALDIAAQICAGLIAAHGKGITHRDVKPSNVMITPQGTVKIMDFGLACIDSASRLTQEGVAIGTTSYMSPEQARGENTDRRTDIWSLGVVIYEMVSGRLPFQGEREAAVLRAACEDTPEPLTSLRTGLPLDLDRIVSKTLAKKPGERYQNVEDLLVDIRACGTGTGQAGPRGRVSRWPWLVGAAACLAALAAGLWIGLPKKEWRNPLEGARYSRLTDFEGTETDASISPDGKLVAFLSDRDGQLDLWLTQVGTQNFSNLTKGTMPGFPRLDDRPLGFDHDGGHVWFHQRKLTQPPWVTMLIPSYGGTPRPFLNAVSAAWSADGKRLVYHMGDSGDPTFLSEPDGSGATRLFQRNPGVHAHHPVWSPDGKHIYFTAGYPPDQLDVWRIPVTGGEAERLTHHNSRVRCPALLDNDTLVYSATADDGIGSCLYSMNLADRIARRATTGLEQYTSVTADEAPAGRGRRMVATLVNPTAAIWSVPITGGVVKESAAAKTANLNGQTQGPRATEDGMLYMAASGPAHALWKREGNGPAIELWKASGGGVVAPGVLSPDGRLVCFSFRRNDKSALYVMNSDGTNLRTLADGFQVRSAASWSPDGKWVVVSGDQGNGNRLFKIAVEGGPPTLLMSTESSWPVWSPDGSRIVYAGPNIGGSRKVSAISPEGKALPFPDLSVILKMDTFRFTPDGKSLVVLQGLAPRRNFWMLDIATGERRQLTDLDPGAEIQSFDVTADGKKILFDRVRTNADIVLIELAQR